MYSRVPIYRLQVKRTLKSQDSILTNQLEILAKVTGGVTQTSESSLCGLTYTIKWCILVAQYSRRSSHRHATTTPTLLLGIDVLILPRFRTTITKVLIMFMTIEKCISICSPRRKKQIHAKISRLPQNRKLGLSWMTVIVHVPQKK